MNRFFFFLLVGLDLLSIGGSGGAKPIDIPNGDLSDRNNNGYPNQWIRRTWSTDATVPDGLIAGEDNGKPYLQLPAQVKGAVGWESPKVSVGELGKGAVIQFNLKASTDYTGNKPWVFVAWYNGSTFMKSTFMKMDDAPGTDWQTENWIVETTDIPKDATDMAVVLATIVDDPAADHKGMLYYSMLQVSEP